MCVRERERDNKSCYFFDSNIGSRSSIQTLFYIYPCTHRYLTIHLDMNLRVVQWNETAEILTGFAREEVFGKSIFEMMVADNHDYSTLKTLPDTALGSLILGTLYLVLIVTL